MRDPKNLRAFQLADELALQVYKATAAFPREELFGLTSQLRRASVSVPSNIVEGCSRSTNADYLRFLEIALGSAHEVEYQLSLAQRLGFLEPENSRRLVENASETCRVLIGLIRAIRAQ